MERIGLTIIVACGKSFIWQVLGKLVDDHREKLFLKCHPNGLADRIFFNFDRNAVIGNVILNALVESIFLEPFLHINRRDGKASDVDLFPGQGLELTYDLRSDIKDAFDSHESSFDEETTVLHFAKETGPEMGADL